MTAKPPEKRKTPLMLKLGPLGLAAIPLLVWLGALANFQNPDERDWTGLRKPGLGFAAEFPRAFNAGEQRMEVHETPEGHVPVHYFGQNTLAFFWGISVAEYPPGADAEPAADILERAVDEQLRQYRAAVDSRENLEVSGEPALKVVGSLPREPGGLSNHNRLHLLVVMRGNRLYRASALGLGNDAMVAHFFDAFRLLPRAQE